MSLINAIINGLLSVLINLIDVFLTPINLLIENLFPDMSEALSAFTQFINLYFGSGLTFFFNILPPIFRVMLVLWFTFVISYYSIYYTYIGILKLFKVIQRVKFW